MGRGAAHLSLAGGGQSAAAAHASMILLILESETGRQNNYEGESFQPIILLTRRPRPLPTSPPEIPTLAQPPIICIYYERMHKQLNNG